jgi:S-DNA-T family DNA segregation ATPase FtsK/SpoIIIE
VRLLREVALYVFAALAGYALLSLLSYSPSDPGWSHAGDSGGIRNLGGRFGAWFADLFLR